MTQTPENKNNSLQLEEDLILALQMRALGSLSICAPWKIGEPIPGQEWMNAYGEEMLGDEF